MSMSENRAEIDIREEVDVIDLDPLYFEKQRSRYASRGVELIVLLNGLAAIALLVTLSATDITGPGREPLADAMVVFGAGAALGLLSKFFAYLRRTIRLERPDLRVEGRPFRWLAVGAAVLGAACFVAGLVVAREGIVPAPVAEPAAVTVPAEPAPGP